MALRRRGWTLLAGLLLLLLLLAPADGGGASAPPPPLRQPREVHLYVWSGAPEVGTCAGCAILMQPVNGSWCRLVGCADDSGPVSAGLNGIAGGLDQCAGTLEAHAANDITGAEFDASIQVCTNGVPVDEMSAEHICTAVWAGVSFLRAVLRNFHVTG